MKIIPLERTPKRVELLKRMGDKNKAIANEALEAFAAFISPVIQLVLNQRVTSNQIFQDIPFSENDRPTIPIDIYLGTGENYIRVWSQTVAGGLPTNLVTGMGEVSFQTYELDSAISFYKSYLRNARLDVLTLGIQRMINEIAVKQERNAWTLLLAAAATASTNGISHVINSTVAGEFQVHDMNRMWTLLARMYTSYVGGTPDTLTTPGLTDLYVSPETMEDVRAFAYNPMNVRGGYDSTGAESDQGNVPLPDSVREQIFRSGGLSEIFNVTLHPLLEFGVAQKYSVIFDNFYGGSFNPTSQQVALGLDLSRNVFLRPVITDDEYAPGGQVNTQPDDQFVSRQEKVGFYTKLKEGRLLLDDRAVTALII